MKIRGLVAVGGGILVHLSIGSIYTFGNMLPYIASYMASQNGNTEADFQYYVTQCSYIFAFTIASQGIFFPFGGKLGQLIGTRLSILLGGWLMSFGVAMSYFTCHSLYWMFLTYGILFGAGIGLAYPNVLVVVMNWFPNHKGFVNGCVLCGFGLSAFIWDFIQTGFINSANIEQNKEYGFLYNQELLDRIPYCFLLMASCYAIMQFMGSLVLRNPISLNNNINNNIQNSIRMDIEEPMLLSEDIPLLENNNYNDNYMINNNNGLTVKEVLKSCKFWHLYLNFLIDGIIVIFIATQWKQFSNEWLGITNDSFLSNIGAFSALFNGFGRVFWGIIYDKIGKFNITLGLLNILVTLFVATWPLCTASSNVMAVIWICALFFLFSGNFSIFPTIVTQCFGVKNNGINIGLIFTAQVFSSFIGIYAVIVVKSWLGSWQYLAWFMAGVQFIGVIVSASFNQETVCPGTRIKSHYNKV